MEKDFAAGGYLSEAPVRVQITKLGPKYQHD
jgi:hypothetical protein